MFLPVNIGGRYLVDGMLAYPVPSNPLRECGCDRVLAVHLKGRWGTPAGPRHLFDVIGQCFSIAQDKSSGLWRPAADLVIEPDVNGYKYDDFEHTADLISAGEATMREAMPLVRSWLVTSPPAESASFRPSLGSKPLTMPAD